MKKEFIGFYEPIEDEIKEAWTNGIFAFDANTLLNLYRYTDVTRKDFLSALKAIEKRLFVPYQAAYEFHNNRHGVIEGLKKSYDDLYKIFETSFKKDLLTQVNRFNRHPSIEIDKISKLQDQFLDKVHGELEKQKKNHPDFNSKDDVLKELTALFENRVGKKFSSEELKKIYSDGEGRYADKIPPGYEDLAEKKKKGNQHVYGDLIIWRELINYTKSEKKPLILVTDDRKEDWWKIEQGKTIRPREELIKEFFDLTGIRILIYNADFFLKYAKEKKLVPKLKEETITEVKKIRIGDETRNSILSQILQFPTYQPQKPIRLSSGDVFYTVDNPLNPSIRDIMYSGLNASVGSPNLTVRDYLQTEPYFYVNPLYVKSSDLSAASIGEELTSTENKEKEIKIEAPVEEPESNGTAHVETTASPLQEK